MSVRTVLGGIIVVALAGGVLYAAEPNIFALQPNGGGDDNDRVVQLTFLVDKGRGHAQYIGDKGMQYKTFGTKITSKMKEPYPKGAWHTEISVRPGTQVRIILTAEEVTKAYCGIRAPFLNEVPPAITPLDQGSETVECSATIR